MSQAPAGMPQASTPATVTATSPWGAAFIGIAAVISVPVALIVFLPLGLSASSDSVLGTEALIGGLASDYVLRKRFRIRLVILEKYQRSILWLWIPLCLYVILIRPFE